MPIFWHVLPVFLMMRGVVSGYNNHIKNDCHFLLLPVDCGVSRVMDMC